MQLYFARFYAKLLLQLFILRKSSGIVLVIFAVAPFTGAWIEILNLKVPKNVLEKVAPFTGAWIEMLMEAWLVAVALCRSLHGSVD